MRALSCRRAFLVFLPERTVAGPFVLRDVEAAFHLRSGLSHEESSVEVSAEPASEKYTTAGFTREGRVDLVMQESMGRLVVEKGALESAEKVSGQNMSYKFRGFPPC